MHTLYFLEAQAYEKIAEARAGAARLRLHHAAQRLPRRRVYPGFFDLLRALHGFLFERPGRSGSSVLDRPAR